MAGSGMVVLPKRLRVGIRLDRIEAVVDFEMSFGESSKEVGDRSMFFLVAWSRTRR